MRRSVIGVDAKMPEKSGSRRRRADPDRSGCVDEAASLDLPEGVVAAESACLGEKRRGEQQPMPENRQEERLDVFRGHVVATADKRPRARRPLERKTPADGGAQCDSLHRARRAHELDGPAHEQLVDVDVLDHRLHRAHVIERPERLERFERMAVPLSQNDVDLGCLVGVPECRAKSEPVKLRLGQRERPLLLDRVLGRDHDERRRQWMGQAIDGHLALGHRFEQC